MIVWDIGHIFHKLDGSKGVLAACELHNADAQPPQPTTVAVWKHRNRIPAEWLPAVFFEYLAQGGALDDAFTTASADELGLGWGDVGL